MLNAEHLEQRELLSLNQIVLNPTTAQVAIDGTNGVDEALVFASATNAITVRLTSGGETVDKVFARSAVASLSFVGKDGNDRFENNTDVPSFTQGDGGDDVLLGGSGRDELYGGSGNDMLSGRDANDVVNGQFGNDSVDGGAGIDLVYGEAGDDYLYGGADDDTLDGGDGHDELYGQTGNDRLDGSLGNDFLHGDAGDDNLLGNSGHDVLSGGDDNDTLNGQAGNDSVDGGAGIDLIYGEAGDDRLYGQAGDDQLFAGDGNDRTWGGDGNDSLDGGPGDDFLHGEAGNDVLFGNSDDDLIAGGDGNDSLRGQAGRDSLDGGAGVDELYGEAGDDRLYGGLDDDKLYGEDGHDVLHGQAGNDLLDGGRDDDRLLGGDGGDELLAGSGNDLVSGGSGQDTLRGQDGNDSLDGWGGIDLIYGEAGDDRLYGGADDDTLDGGAGHDYLFGRTGNDRLDGSLGNDFLYGEAGNDNLLGNSDHDLLSGGDDNDTLNGQSGNDWIDGGAGIDLLYGEAGDDWLDGQAGDDQLFAGDGNDVAWGGDGNDRLEGLLGNDVLIGGAGADELTGGSDNDALSGGAGNDTSNGQAGTDVLIGGTNIDSLVGEAGDDLVIGGLTQYDENADALRLLLNTWSSGASYSARIAAIEDELFAARLESTRTVFDDEVADSVFGGTDQDWFFQTGSFVFYNPNAGEHSHEANEQDDPGHSHPGPEIVSTPPTLEGFDLLDSLDHLSDVQSDETIHSKLPHADNPTLQREHLALFQMVRYDEVSHVAVSNGAWSSPSTWQNGVVPTNGARVLVPINVRVTVDGVIAARIDTIRVDGTLAFSTSSNTELRVDTIVVSTTGGFEMGTAAQPVPASIRAKLIFTDDGPINRIADPFGMSRGLISHGRVSIHGAPVTSHLAVVGAPQAGAATLLLSAIPTGWKVGDWIVLAGTTAGAEQNEVRRISGIFGTTLALDQPLVFDHAPLDASLAVHVAHLSRNVSMDSENTAVDRRGHLMLMHNRNVHIANAGFYRMGRTNKLEPINDPDVDAQWNLAPGTGTNPRARYAVHFHRTGTIADGNPAVVEGSVVSDSPGWGFVNHSSYVDIRDNVAFDVDGAGFTTEVGDEIGGFHGNIAIGSTGSGEQVESRLDIQDFGHQGDGFWFQGGGVTVTDNIAAGNEGSAFAYFTRGLIENGVRGQFLAINLPDPSMAGGGSAVSVEHVPIFEFQRNTGYASTVGLNLWYHLRGATHGVEGLLENSTFWNNTTGADLSYTQNTTLNNMSFRHAFGEWPMLGVTMNTVTRDITYNNLNVSGYTWGIAVPRQGQSTVNGGYFNNKYDIVVQTGIMGDRSVLITGPIVFGVLPPDAAIGQHFDIHMRHDSTPIHNSISYVFSQDTVTVNYGTLLDRRVYYPAQTATAVPFPTAGPGIPAAYVGLTNQQLKNQFGLAVGGEIAPLGTLMLPSISGLVGFTGSGVLP